MWVWYCRPPIGAHFHPTPQPPPAIGGESAFTYCGSSFSQCDGYDVGISQRAGAGAGPQAAPAPACGPHCSSSICFTGTVLTTCLPRVCFIATAVRRSHSSCYYYYDPEGGSKLEKSAKSWVCLVISAATIWQTVMQKNSVKELYQTRNWFRGFLLKCQSIFGQGIFSVFNWPFSGWTWVSRCLLKQRIMEVVVTTGTISRAKL